jgi:hypothetical protein
MIVKEGGTYINHRALKVFDYGGPKETRSEVIITADFSYTGNPRERERNNVIYWVNRCSDFMTLQRN